MSIRSLTRQPKRMLVFFEADKTTCILPTNRIKNILDQNKELSEGSRVEILYEKELFEAQVLKLHDDCTVLSDVESQLELDGMLAEHNDGKKEKGFKIVEARNPLGDMTNKENVEPRAQPTPIGIKGNSQSGDPKKRKSVGEVESKGKLKKNKRSKNSNEAKLITIEAEESAASVSGTEAGKAAVERKAGTLDFLSTEAQLRVQRLLEICEEKNQVDATTQVPNSTSISNSTQTPPVSEIGNVGSCSCHEKILENQKNIQQMLHELLKRSTSKVPQFNPQFPAVQPIISPTVMDLSALGCTFVMEPSNDPVLPATPSPSKNSPEPSTSTTPILAVNNQIVASSSSSTQIFEDVFKRSSSMPNYAKNLVFELFRQDELVNKNCAGVKGKQAIGNDP